ncbi:hypothetical protein [Flavobacterium sp.]|uniref:hypothetical protein n=1 Tax=Flavobacterium sp. TaxID=239 RepID=UPI0025DBE96F|nr:hypothetical protein [Flavobacterium sp.]
MKSDKIAVETYKYFSNLEGNQHIATEFALKIIAKIVKKYQPKNILELGLGIGSISCVVLKFTQSKNQAINYLGTEANYFCLMALPKYLKEHYNRLTIFNALEDVVHSQQFDLIIIDGKDENILRVKDIISRHGIIIIEGDRMPQLNSIRTIFPNSFYTRVISNYKNPNYGPFSATDYSGGLQLLFINPTFKQKLDYLFYKFQTAIRYKIR